MSVGRSAGTRERARERARRRTAHPAMNPAVISSCGRSGIDDERERAWTTARARGGRPPRCDVGTRASAEATMDRWRVLCNVLDGDYKIHRWTDDYKYYLDNVHEALTEPTCLE